MDKMIAEYGHPSSFPALPAWAQVPPALLWVATSLGLAHSLWTWFLQNVANFLPALPVNSVAKHPAESQKIKKGVGVVYKCESSVMVLISYALPPGMS